MYLRGAHAEIHIPTLRQFIRNNALGIMTTALPSQKYPLLQCTHIPWILDIQDESSETELGKLRGHMARANPHAKAIIEAMENAGIPSGETLEQEVMILFNGPVHHYVTPKFYVETKPVTGKVVPTWDYTAAQVYGKARFWIDSRAEATGKFLTKAVNDLSFQSETVEMGYTGGDKPSPWKVDDAPKSYTDLLKKSIIGIEVEITRLEGRFKMSQERPKGDRDGVIEGFRALKSERGDQMAETISQRSELYDQKAH